MMEVHAMTPAKEGRLTDWSALHRSLPVLALLVAPLLAAPAAAQRADFLFGGPHATLSASTGWSIPSESSDLFRFSREQLTVGRGDFASPFFLAELGIHATSRLDVMAGLEVAGRTVDSEMRDWVTQDDQPIRQSTEFSTRRVLGGLKVYLLPRGREISRFAWVPRSWSPYVGGGVGMTWYTFRQEGDFVDYETLDIFEDRLEVDGSGFTQYAVAGVDVTLSSYFLLRMEYRHLWGSADVGSGAFEDFNDIDLSGSRATLGIGFRI